MSVPQLPTPAPTPAVKTGNRQVSVERKLAAEMSVSVIAPLVRIPDASVREALARADLRKPVASVHEEEESARGEISDEDYYDGGLWVSKGNPIRFLDSHGEEMVDKWGHEWRERRMSKLTEDEWKDIAEFLLSHTVDLVDSELLEGDIQMKQFDLALRILGEDGSVDGEGRRAISKAFWNLAVERDDSCGRQDDVDDKLEARDKMIAGLRGQLAEVTTRKDSSELEKQLTDQTYSIVLLAEDGMRMKEELQIAEQKVEEAEEKTEEKWRAWAEKEVQVKAGKAVSAERKKWQAKLKALPVETVMTATQTDHIQKPKAIQVDDGTQTEVALEELEKAMEKKRERKGKGRAKDSEDVVMKDGSDNSDTYQEMYEDLSGYEDEDEALVAAPPATKKQAAPRSAARPAGKRSRPTKTPPRSTSLDDNGPLVKATVIHGVPYQRPMADTIQDVGVKGIMGATLALRRYAEIG